MIDCLICLRIPAHSVELGGGESVEFCEACWADVESRFGEASREYRSLLARGIHPLMAERMMIERPAVSRA